MVNYIIDRVQSVTESNPAMNPPKTYVLIVDWHEEGSDELNVGDIYGLLPDDPYGMAPTLRQWMIDHKNEYTIVPYTPPAAPAHYIIPKTKPWDRMTNEEADNVYGQMTLMDAKLRGTYDAAQYLDTQSPLWPVLLAFLSGVVGETRAKELLAPET